jgi:hypothetical protein
MAGGPEPNDDCAQCQDCDDDSHACLGGVDGEAAVDCDQLAAHSDNGEQDHQACYGLVMPSRGRVVVLTDQTPSQQQRGDQDHRDLNRACAGDVATDPESNANADVVAQDLD